MPSKKPLSDSEMREMLLEVIANAETSAEKEVYKKMLKKLSNENKTLAFGRTVTITGIYQECILAQRQDVTYKHRGMYKIVMDDGTAVVLLPPYMKESIRPSKEVEKMKGKRVIVKGMVSPKTNMEDYGADPRKAVLSVSIPCFTFIDSIELAE